jgi:hypothetical protein
MERQPLRRSNRCRERRALAFGLLATTIGVVPRRSAAAPHIIVSKDLSCGCWSAWVEHLRSAKFVTHVREISGMRSLKRRLGVPAALASCRTPEVENFVIEGMFRRLSSGVCWTNGQVPSASQWHACRSGRPEWKCPEALMNPTKKSCSAWQDREYLPGAGDAELRLP